MKCPNCGADMPEGELYCARCGKDIHIVPDFETGLEDNIARAIGDPLEEKEEKDRTAGTGNIPAKRGKKNSLMLIMSICLSVLLITVAVGGIFLYLYYSYDYQLHKAEECFAREEFDEAISHYRRALELDGTDVEVSFSLAEAQLRKGNKLEYEYLLRDIIRNPLCSQEHLEKAYGKLIDIYVSRGEYDTIDKMLKFCENGAVQSAYQSFMALPPEFSHEEGEYEEAVNLKLTACAPGIIYYTLDGSQPGENGFLYTAPVELTEDADVKAIFINNYGVVSDVAERKFVINIELEQAPYVSIPSGQYNVPMLIEVSNETGADIYYTTDGSDPTILSQQYTAPLHMPLGDSIYKFASQKEDGTLGETAVLEYHLVLDTDITTQDAEKIVIDRMLEQKKIINEEGYFSEGSASRYLYQFLYASEIEEAGNYYVVAELLQDEAGSRNWTGSYYAVNIYSGECFRLQMENGSYKLAEIIMNPLE